MQRLEGFLDGRRRIEPVDLVEVHVVHAEPAERSVDRVHQVLAREAPFVGAVLRRKVRLGRDHQLIARGELLDRAAHDLFAHAARVHVGGVEEIDALLDRALQEWPALRLVKHPRAPFACAVGHRAEADA